MNMSRPRKEAELPRGKPSNAEIKTLFDAVAPRYDVITHPYALARRIEFFVNNAKGKCLEVGAGSGEISKALIAKGLHVIATDIAPQMAAQIRNKLGPVESRRSSTGLGIEVVACDAESLPFADQSFDTVIGAEMIYYLDHPERFLAEAHRALKPGGRLLLSSANASIARFYDLLRSMLRNIGIGRGTYFDDPVRQFPTPKELTRLLQDAGFEIREIKKAVVVPLGTLDWLNRILEKTPLRHLGAFIYIAAEKR